MTIPDYDLKRYYERRVRELGGEDTMPRYDQLGMVMWMIWRALVEEAYPLVAKCRSVNNGVRDLPPKAWFRDVTVHRIRIITVCGLPSKSWFQEIVINGN